MFFTAALLTALPLGALAASIPTKVQSRSSPPHDSYFNKFYIGPITFKPEEYRMYYTAVDNLVPVADHPIEYPQNITFATNAYNVTNFAGGDFTIDSWPQGEYVTNGTGPHVGTYSFHVDPVANSTAFALTVHHSVQFLGPPLVAIRSVKFDVPPISAWNTSDAGYTYTWEQAPLNVPSQIKAPAGWVGDKYDISNPLPTFLPSP